FREEERSVWQRIPPDAPGWVSEFGELHGLINLEPQKQIEIQPYFLAQYDTYPKEDNNPFRDGEDFTFNGGLDGKIGITNDLTLDFTFNPDFGQVEADPAAISLDGFQIFFEEQRPFFVENKNIFNYQFADNQDNIFYSRRIGRSPQGYPDISGIEFSDQPSNTTILGAAKFSGKTKNGWSIGVLESVTAKEYAEIDNNGDKREELVEPLTNYFVGRLQKDFNNKNTFIGGIFTATNRKIEGNLNFLRQKAYTGGLDFKHQWKSRKYYAEGNFIVSNVQGSKEAITNTQESLTHLFQRIDAKHVSVDPNKTSLTGTGGKIEAGKNGSGNWSYNGGFTWRSPELELNDIGFLRQADELQQYINLHYQTLKPFSIFRKIDGNFQQFTTYDFDGNYNRLQFRASSHVQFKNNWWTDIGLIYKPRIFSNTALRGGPRFLFSDEFANWWYFGTDSRKKLRFRFGYVISKAKQDHFGFYKLETGITYQPTNALNISINPEFSYNPNKTQYVTEESFKGDPRYITAEIDNQTFSTSIRINYTINPNLSIQYYAEPFVSRGNYSNFNHITNPVTDDLYDRFKLYDENQISFDEGIYYIDENKDGNPDYSFDEPDFAFVQFRSNLVLRWEYIPGSEIFLVWSQGTTGFG
ncbi:MAG: hydrolase, partial [Flavobacteriaceae bacterium]|nr:hydrolase [Flavobacteriaceae bacterium]